LRALPSESRAALLLLLLSQLIAFVYFVVVFPVQYDEWHSWHFFSNESFIQVLTSYPAPNNHVFYNLVSHIFVLLPIDPEVAIRIPALLSSLAATYCFFRLLARYLAPWISLMLTALFVGQFYFIFYGFSGRGYMFVYLFTILLLLACEPLSQNYSGRYRRMFVLSQFLGLFTVPSFLYVMFAPGIVLFVYVLLQRSVKKIVVFIGDYILIAVLTIAAYSGILFFGDAQALLNPESWTEKFTMSDPDWWDKLLFYLDTKFFEIFGVYKMKTAALIAALVVIYYGWKKKRPAAFMSVLCLAMFFSPLLIVLLHRVYPFGRSLFFLVIPSFLLLGLALAAFLELCNSFIKRSIPLWIRITTSVVSLLLLIIVFVNYPARHREGAEWDYHLYRLRETVLKDAIRHIDDIGKTGVGYEFYPADILLHMAHKENPSAILYMNFIDSVRKQDILIIHHTELPRLRPQLKGYSFLLDFHEIRLFVSDSLQGYKKPTVKGLN
jgi:hypothetical protein